jgi:uncharacterized protein (TIGR00251 family)
VNLLSWILALEVLFLLSAYICWIAGKMAARERPDDALYLFSLVFWRTFRQKPLPMKRPVLDDVDEPGFGGEDQLAQSLAGNDADAPAQPGAPAEGDAGVRQATINVRVVPHSQRDQIAGFDGKTLRVNVMASPESGSANKAVIDLIANTLGIKGHQILLLRGHYQSQKTLQISGIPQSDLDARLSSFD